MKRRGFIERIFGFTAVAAISPVALARLATQVPDDAKTLAKALYQIVSAGYDGAAGMELLEVSTIISLR